MDESNLSQSGDADVSIAADPTVCECRTTCQRKSGNSACPCRMYDLFCSESCQCGTRTRHCANREPPDSSDSEDDEHNERFTEGMPEQLEDTIEEKIKTFVHELGREDLENVATDLLKRNPGAYEDYLLKENSSFQEESDHSPKSPGWCNCGRCKEMPQDVEKKCCRLQEGCLSTSEVFLTVCINAHVLEVAMRATEDILADAAVRTNKNYRHYAYKQFIYWQHGRLGAGRRRVIPSCCIWAIRMRFPAANNMYKGFEIGNGILED
ncbi:P2X purinoceptor 7-like [Apostichopus japonicus]|uniref:P2X purinoceptor 7-like n=1 Tax=Stichopus japonicus TaxID=307972 RepID=UPI003AB67752